MGPAKHLSTRSSATLTILSLLALMAASPLQAAAQPDQPTWPPSPSPPTPTDAFTSNEECPGFDKYASHNLTCLTPFLRDYDRAVTHRQQFDLEAPGVVNANLLAADGSIPVTRFPSGSATWVYDVLGFPYLGKVGVSQALFRLTPCSSNLPHIHPRGTELVTILAGRMNLTLIEENGGRVATVAMSAVGGISTFAVEQGLPHAQHNLECEDVLFLASFPSADPGVVALTPALAKFPAVTIATAFNISIDDVPALVERIKGVPTVAQGDAECLARCGLSKR